LDGSAQSDDHLQREPAVAGFEHPFER